MSYLVCLFGASCKMDVKIKNLDLNQTLPTKTKIENVWQSREIFYAYLGSQLELTQKSFRKSTRSNDHSTIF